MRILVVNWQDRENPHAGGAEIHLHEIFGRLAARGHEVTLLGSGWPGAPQYTTLDGIDVHRVGTRYTFQFVARRYYQRVLAAKSFDVLVEDINKVPLWTPRWGAKHTVALVPHLFGTTAFQEVAAPLACAVWLQERPIGLIYRDVPFEAISESTADDLAARGISRSRIAVIYPGIDTATYTPGPAERSPVPLVVYLGRLKRYKRVDLIIRAFAAMKHPTAQLAIAGAGDHKPVLEALAHSLDLGERVKFLGFISEAQKVSLLRSAWVLAFTSPKEGWGITNLEAAACATPVVASSSPGLRESVVDGETGFLVPHGDLPALVRALGRIVGDRALVDKLGTAGRIFAERFTWDSAAAQTEAHLQRVIEARIS
ncbi:MAG TPA: glycosyltransferase family 4 protein [Gemmatimonadaceae bacterium]|nr:glycosyltransferase family 4 protein [Gemmatimonadaceae bacterium]